ncbi:MAG: glutamate-5-semialdehyde dehydrogenase [Candidatus Omnitrophica bacterium CG12_big_fil_rev_8_21_14_0_65_43_15]|uniref:Gamma-glutamyl phosphate reductase n=1 Tax=Candidatus Taenaricola geysiri TaxID=1974752 RepID=A0A2J0LE78_9BACT|nr:MAG: glutamate-5-semialdehyde dehydrogenase [Candidatus Omnitrophica bacterium CG1_02_43_210]PIR65672.1 MAG: glutamate-5-semialdehyde dehydrogenase [Candidatus Omnitrophica bacterium CG10_big_fil_rev_8_21_14_0_10_43_8]PIV12499.1 MAG: glutamate-5-semialdehyde dehydrogenase [Candidatus Omnitrophica bacterium CG03_land_8_20_14_0_80_43_22]PIW66158.1 MAG: glutamate-5-semialdehyde dehydrogenase [Candidatus Omnitrophica bacterium CG12_big_fil_rev_8_21_14_0_65_43_15]PIW80511.1 MAG: glutamate-5-semia
MKNRILKTAQNAKTASRKLALITRKTKDKALISMAGALIEGRSAILKANQKDLAAAKKFGLSMALIDRLRLDDKRIAAMADSLKAIAGLDEVIGSVIESWSVKNGLIIRKVSVPIGVIGIIYESRPNVTSDCAGLCLKSGNSVILRGGKEAFNSNTAIFKILEKTASNCGIPKGAINMIATTDRNAVKALLQLNNLIDLVMPRGGEGLIREVTRVSRIPVIKHYKGVCHVYVDKSADLKMAEEVCFNAKVQRPGVCNAMETMLVHKDVAKQFLPRMIKKFEGAGVKIRGLKSAEAIDWSTEYLDLILAVKIVDSLEAAVEHINKYGSMHSDAIIAKNPRAAQIFLDGVDSACVYTNASTRFTDGGEFGFGAEIGISTEKLHARGPMALKELTTYKYHIIGSGQIRK